MNRSPNRLAGGLSAAIVLLALATSGSAQGAEPIVAGRAVRASLGSTSPTRDNDAPYRVHWYSAAADERVVITMTSGAFDPLLIVGRPPGSSTRPEDLLAAAEDDDGGEGISARLEYRFATAGRYAIVATAYRAGAAGEYELLVQRATPASSPGGSTGSTPASGNGARYATLGATLTGRLEPSSPVIDGRHYETFWYRAQRGERVVATLRSEDFDTYLAVAGPFSGAPSRSATYTDNRSDDDGADGTNSRLDFTFPEGGLWAFRARSYRTGLTGAFTFTLERGTGPQPQPNPNEAPRARRPGEPQPARPPVTRPGTPRRVTLDEAVEEGIRAARAEGLSIGYNERVRLNRYSPHYFEISGPVPGEEFTIMVLEEGGAPAWIFARRIDPGGRVTEKTTMAVIEDRSTPGLMRSGTRFIVPSIWPRGSDVEFTVNAGPASGEREVRILVFGK